MDIFIALSCIVLALLLAWRWQRTSIFRNLGIPGPKPNLLFGNLIELYRKGPIRCHEEWGKKYGRVFGYYYGMNPVLLVTDPSLLKNILIKDFHKFMNREAFDPLAKYDPNYEHGQSILVLPGQAWKNVRSVLTPTFTTAKMKQMAESINSSIDDMMRVFRQNALEEREFNIYDAYQRLTLDIITRTAFGVRTDVQKNPKSKVLRATKSLFEAPFRSPTTFIGLSFPWLRRVCIKIQEAILAIRNGGRLPHAMLRKGIKEVVQHRRENPQTGYNDLLQLMIDASISSEKGDIDVSKLEAGNTEIESKSILHEESSTKKFRSMKDGEIISSAFVVLLAGYETTSTALGFTTYLLAKHQDVQERLFQEIHEIIQSGEKLDFATINKLPYLDKVLNESMRIYPPVVLFITRYALEDVEYDNLKIPKDLLVQAPVYSLHHDPEFWSDPETFDPERFSTKQNSNGITYLPFGVGPRNCLGMRFAQLEAKLALANVVHKFRLNLSHKHKDTLQTHVSLRILAPSKGVHVRLESRSMETSS